MYRIVDEEMEIPEGCSPSLVDFLTQCFRKNARDRPTAEDLFEHEWIKSQIGLDPGSLASRSGLRSLILIQPSQHLRHHDSIPFLRRISTDAFKLREEPLDADQDRSWYAGPQESSDGNEFRRIPETAEPRRPNLPAVMSSLSDISTAPSPQGILGLTAGEETETARLRRLTFEKLSRNATQNPPEKTDSTATGSRLFSLTSHQENQDPRSMRSLSGGSLPKQESKTAGHEELASKECLAASAGITGTMDQAGSKTSEAEVKSECTIM